MAFDVANSTYGVDHISGLERFYQPAVSNTFKVLIERDFLTNLLFAGVDPNGTINQETDYIDNYLPTGNSAQKVIELSVMSGKVPHFTIDAIEIRRGNSRVKFAGQPSFDNEDLTLHDWVGARTKDILMAWQARAYDVVNDIVNTSDKYKCNCELIEYAPDGVTKVRSWTLYGAWIGSISEENFNSQERKERQITATLHYDRAIPTHDTMYNLNA